MKQGESMILQDMLSFDVPLGILETVAHKICSRNAFVERTRPRLETIDKDQFGRICMIGNSPRLLTDE